MPSDTQYCGLPRRLMAILYDSIIILGLLVMASALALPFGDSEKTAFKDLGFTVWLIAVCFAYLGASWHYGGMTVGMRAWRIRVSNADGQAVSWPQCVLRFVVGFVSLAAFGGGLLWALVDKKNRSWHDLAAKTLLLKSNRD